MTLRYLATRIYPAWPQNLWCPFPQAVHHVPTPQPRFQARFGKITLLCVKFLQLDQVLLYSTVHFSAIYLTVASFIDFIYFVAAVVLWDLAVKSRLEINQIKLSRNCIEAVHYKHHLALVTNI